MNDIRALKEYKKRILMEIVQREISSLDMEQKTVLFLRFGLDGEEPKTVKQIAKILGTSEQSIETLENDALRALYSKK